MTTYTAPAKINLSLRVQSKLREDGYHNVDILMAPIDLYDQLDFHNSRTTTLLCDTPGVPTDESNLVIKAVREFEKSYGRKAKQRITLTKRIPHGAGLGGGSADAAVTVRLMIVRSAPVSCSLTPICSACRCAWSSAPRA